MGFDLSNYETVEQRLVRWWAAYPNGRVYTCMMNYTGDACVFYCELYADKDDKVPVATGYAEEIKTIVALMRHRLWRTVRPARSVALLPTARYRPLHQALGRRVMRCKRLSAYPRHRKSTHPLVPLPHRKADPLGYIKKLAKDAGLDDLGLLELIQRELNSDEAVLELLKSHEASKIIGVLR
jgi:hypothetical protein